MKACKIIRKRKVKIFETPIPHLKDNDVLIKVKAAGICGTDVHIFKGDYFSSYPIIPGHEFSGVIEKVGGGVTRFKAGENVTADPNNFCENCFFCNQNLQNHCERFEATGVTYNGAFAEYVAVPESSVFKIGDISFEKAAFTEPLACVVYGEQRIKIEIGADVLIFGAGPIGLLHLQLSKHNGASTVTVVDLNGDRLKLAKKMGADNIVHADRNMEEKLFSISKRGFQVVIDATGVKEVIENSIKYVRNDGYLLLFGVCGMKEKIELKPYEIFKRDIKIVGSFALRKTFQNAINLLKNNVINVEPLIGDRISLDEVPDTLKKMSMGRANMKVLIISSKG